MGSPLCLTGLMALLLAAASAVPLELRLGGAISLTGELAVSGQAVQQGWVLWAERVNTRGGILLANGNTAKIKLPLDLRDDESSASKSQQLLAEMLDSQSPNFADLHFVIGPVGDVDGPTRASAEAATQAGHLFFANVAVESLNLTGAVNNHTFSTLAADSRHLASGLQLLHAHGAASLLIGHGPGAAAAARCAGANATAQQLGMTTKGYISHHVGAADSAAVILQIKLLNPDVYVGCSSLQDLGTFMTQLQVLDVLPKALLVDTGASVAQIVNAVGRERSHGLLNAMQWHQGLAYSDSDAFFGSAQDFHNSFVDRFGREPTLLSASSAAMGYALQHALQDAASTQEALMSLQVDSFFGRLSFDASVATPEAATVQIQRGAGSAVAPQRAVSAGATALEFPSPSWSERALLLHPCSSGHQELAAGSGQCTPCPIGTFRDATMIACQACAAGHHAGSAGSSSCEPCPPGNWSSDGTTCEACPAGHSCDGTVSAAHPPVCPEGHYCPVGSTSPTACAAGTFSSLKGGNASESCLACPIGHFSASAGASSCSPCSPGWSNSEAGQMFCMRCAPGTYQELAGQGACDACPATYVTMAPGAASSLLCACPPGKYLDRSKNRCADCPVFGATCFGGALPPFILEGYYGEKRGDIAGPLGDPSSFSGVDVWECPHPQDVTCPGDPALPVIPILGALRFDSVCPPMHKGIACAACEEGYVLLHGECQQCGSAASWMLLILIGAVIVSLVAVHKYSASWSGGSASKATMLLGSTVCVAMSIIQFLALLLYKIEVMPEMPGTIDSLLQPFQLISLLDIAALQPDCLFSNAFKAQYAVRLVLPIFFLAVASAVWGCWWAIGRVSSVSTPKLGHIVDVCGTIATLLYLPVTKMALGAFEHRNHYFGPDTLYQYGWVLAGSEEHSGAFALGIVAVLVYSIGLFVLLAMAVVMVPRKVPNSRFYQTCLRFAYGQWRPERWYWGLVFLFRNFFASLIVVAFPYDPSFHPHLLFTVLAIFTALTTVNEPWREAQNNMTDTIGMALLLCVVAWGMQWTSMPRVDPALIHGAWVYPTIVLLVLLALLTIFFRSLCKKRASRRRVEEEWHYAHLMLLSATLVQMGKALGSVTDSERLAKALDRTQDHTAKGDLHHFSSLLSVIYGVQQAAPKSYSMLAKSRSLAAPILMGRRQAADDQDEQARVSTSSVRSSEVRGWAEVGSSSMSLNSSEPTPSVPSANSNSSVGSVPNSLEVVAADDDLVLAPQIDDEEVADMGAAAAAAAPATRSTTSM